MWRTMPGVRVARDVLGLFKLRIGFMIMLTALVGLAITPGPAPGWPKVLVLALAVLVSSASAGAFNQYYERDTDRLMARTRGRAFVTGALPYSPAWLLRMCQTAQPRRPQWTAYSSPRWIIKFRSCSCCAIAAKAFRCRRSSMTAGPW